MPVTQEFNSFSQVYCNLRSASTTVYNIVPYIDVSGKIAPQNWGVKINEIQQTADRELILQMGLFPKVNMGHI